MFNRSFLRGGELLQKSLLLCVLGSFSLLGLGCATGSNDKSVDGSSSDKVVLNAGEIETFRANDPELPEIPVPEFDEIPEDVQPMVQKWVDYFRGRGREHMERYLARSTRYERLMKRILRENNIPEDIIYIALIESGFSPRAISRARAVGYWQFIRGTGRRYGLAINTFVDERRDPVLATQAAADYFKGLYGEFNSWFLSMASYNVGEGRVRREMNRLRTRDFWDIAKRRRLPKETINYVPKFLAARLIARAPEKYGFKDIPYEPPIEFETAHFNDAINMKLLADKLDIDYAEVKRLNPKYRGEVAPLENNALELRLPLNMKEAAMAAAGEATVKNYVFIPDKGETDVYKVRRGDTLLKIAKHFRTSVAHLREINDFRRRSRLRPGRTIFVPIVATPVPLTSMVASRASEKKDQLSVSQSTQNNPSIQNPKSIVSNTGAAANTKVEPVAVVGGTQGASSAVGAVAGKVGDVVASALSGVRKEFGANNQGPKAPEETFYVIQDGESLAEVATKNNMTMEELMELNNFSEGQTIAAGMQLKVNKILPDSGEPSVDDLPSSTADVEVAAKQDKNEASFSSEAPPLNNIVKQAEFELTHKVLPGETLFSIAQRYNTTVVALRKANNLKRRKTLRAGALLKIPKNQELPKTTGSSSFHRAPWNWPFSLEG